jgi:ubiquinone/menaquinone biosynthesis C-methylase UbiE
MSFYSQIAEYYSHIFPLSQGQLSFILSRSPNSQEMKLLEVGCGIGELSMELGKHFGKVSGIDLDEVMIQKANLLSRKQNPNLAFYKLNMLNLDQQFKEHHFDRIVCFGNTLVHLLETQDILRFFEQCQKVLHENGRLMFQILNYDKILDMQIKQLPLIDNKTLRFERSYEFGTDPTLIQFHTKLWIKESMSSYSNVISLNPIRKNTIETLLSKARFQHYHFFGSYEQAQFQKDSELLLCEAV